MHGPSPGDARRLHRELTANTALETTQIAEELSPLLASEAIQEKATSSKKAKTAIPMPETSPSFAVSGGSAKAEIMTTTSTTLTRIVARN